MYRMMQTDPHWKSSRGRSVEDADDQPLRPPPRRPKEGKGLENNAFVQKSSTTSEKENHGQTNSNTYGDLLQPLPTIATTTNETIHSPSSAAKPTLRPAYQKTLSSSDDILFNNNDSSITKVHAASTTSKESSAPKDSHKTSNMASHPRGSSPLPTAAAAAATNEKVNLNDDPPKMSTSGKEKRLAANHRHHHHHEEEMKEQDNHGNKHWSENSIRQQPGAFNVHGSKTEKMAAGFISPHVEQQEQEMQQTTTTVAAASVATVQNLPQSTATVTPTGQDEEVFTVVAKVTTECEIEEQVRQRILQEAVQADVVPATATVENSSSSNFNSDQGTISTSITNSSTASKTGFKTKLFGTGHTVVDISASPETIRKRDLLEWSVTYSPKTNAWIASVHTNQKALDTNDAVESTRTIETFSSPTKRQAEEVGLVMAPPRMLAFSENPTCFICKGTFAVFRRASHCRNCGVCVCSTCSTTWPSSMIPDTYNIKNESRVTVCNACNWSNASFRDALLCGQYDQVVSLYTTGNINVTRPFSNARGGEVARPIHCAVKGGNLHILKWLVEERCCPIRHPLQTSRNGTIRDLGPIRTSKKRSLLNIAMSDHKLDFVRYLVTDQNMSLFEERGLNPKNALQNFTVLLQMLPETFFMGRQSELNQLLTEVQSSSFGQPMTIFDAALSTVESNSVVGVISQDHNHNDDHNLDGFEEEKDENDEKITADHQPTYAEC